MKRRSSRPGDTRHHERRFAERQTARGDDDESLATREGRPVRLPASGETGGEVAEELEGNALADGIAALVDAVRPHLRAIGLAAAGVLLAAIAWMWMNQQRAALEAKSWDDYMFAITPVDPAALADVVTRHPGTAAAEWARLIQAEMALDEGAQLLFADRGQAQAKLQAAVDGYGELLVRRPKGLLAERAAFGLAKANESLGRIEEARVGYETVAADYPDGALASMARGRARALSGSAAREWYDWFAAQPMVPPSAKPADEGPILGLPGDGIPPASGGSAPADVDSGAPAADAAPAAETPADVPAADAPADAAAKE